MYDPKIGQFLSEDPIEFEALDPNLRRYVGNSSTMFADPTGLAEESPFWGMPEGGESALGATFYAQTKKAPPPPKRGPTPDKLGWGDFTKVKEPPDGSDKSAFTGTDPFSKRSGLDVVPKDGGKVSLKPYEFRLEFDLRQSWYVEGKNTGPLLEHERLHLAMFQEMARLYTEFMRRQTITLKGTTPDEIKKNLTNQLNAMEQQFKDFAKGISEKYDTDTMHGALPGPQAEWQREWQNKIKEFWKNYPKVPK